MSLLASSGTGISRSLSNLPGLRSAGSTMSGLLVAAMTNTFSMSSSPSMDVSSWLTTLSVAPES